ncbi:MAG: tetratricopeptide repeat protein, partial [Myxococcales bacterium]|nr:tetratricopeptide repeat protein [Myxococcales bacterium]
MADKKGAKDEPEDDRDDDESAEGEQSSDSSDAANAAVERDESTKGVAKALGVDDDDEDGESEEEEPAKPAAPPNRAARRREEALKKRRATRGGEEKVAAKKSDDEDEEDEDEAEERPVVAARDPLPKDKNARAKELLRRRKEAAEGKSANIGLSAGEVVQDQIARAGGAAGRWFQRHFRKIIVGSVVGVAAVVGTIQYLNYRDEQAGKASDALMKGVANEGGRVFNDEIKDVRPEAYKAYDPTPVFTSFGARTDAALVSYTELAGKHAGTGVGVLAKLSEAGALLDKAQFQQAENAFEEVLKTDLAKADIDVRA